MDSSGTSKDLKDKPDECQDSDSEEVVTPLMLDGTYLSRNIATLGPYSLPATV
jgi:hypothetical protein